MQVVEYEGDLYPYFQTIGNASQFAIPFAKHVCNGSGYDIGCMKQEWAFPGSTAIDLNFDDPWHADNLPEGLVDYIFSSHCLEHVPHWVNTMDYWFNNLKVGGVYFSIFLIIVRSIGDLGITGSTIMCSLLILFVIIWTTKDTRMCLYLELT